MTDEETLAGQGFRLVTLAEFEAATDVPAGTTREVVRRVIAAHGGAFVVYDPNDYDQGWLLVGDDRAELARETVEYRCQPEPDLQPEQPSLL
jgi:hypothetical protein